MSENKTVSGGGIGFFGLLAIVFITLKLTGHITWSWWWVLAPIWGFAVMIIFLFLFILILSIAVYNGK